MSEDGELAAASAQRTAICAKGGQGAMGFPLLGDGEQEWPRGVRIILYLMGLVYCFMGVAIISDVFMGAIEKVTSKKVRRFDKAKGKYYTFEVWNPTVANLTLMALGSSAPEILLNVIDIFAKDFYLEGLGPSTIVGSAAFNLLIIIAVCIAVIPSYEVRFIKEMPVYLITAAFSIFAYLWLVVILIVSSPNVVEVWEGVLTFLLFPVLCGLAFAADKGCFGETSNTEASTDTLMVHEDMTSDELAEAEAEVRSRHEGELTSEQVSRILAVMYPPPTTRAKYRIQATREMFGGKRVQVAKQMRSSITASISNQMSFMSRKKVVPITDEPEVKASTLSPKGHCAVDSATIFFALEKYAVFENVGAVTVKVLRTGHLDSSCTVNFKTVDGTAKKGQDYIELLGQCVFEVGQTEAEICVKIIDDAAYEADEEFYIELYEPHASEGAVALGTSTMTIVIIDDDDAGVLSFVQETQSVPQKVKDYEAEFKVLRKAGSCGEISCSFKTEADSAIPGLHYEEAKGEVTFENQQMEASIKVTIKGQGRYEVTDRFRLVLFNPTGGAKLDNTTDGGVSSNILTITIEADDEAKDRIDLLSSMLRVRFDKAKVGHSNWAQQFRAALYVNGGDDEGTDTPPTTQDVIMHMVSFPWKLLFALVPPTDFMGGWLCFVCALGMIGFVTAIISDIASLLGCVMCISDDITAITFVALGTSLPDTFASKTAAIQDTNADASVGNVTGSNSVNVFLGLGLPWMIASIHWALKSEDSAWSARYQMQDGLDWLGSKGNRRLAFVVQADSLSFSVIVFSCCAVSCLLVLGLRRHFLGGELGGPRFFKYLSSAFLTFLWFVYIGFSTWKSLMERPATCAS